MLYNLKYNLNKESTRTSCMPNYINSINNNLYIE